LISGHAPTFQSGATTIFAGVKKMGIRTGMAAGDAFKKQLQTQLVWEDAMNLELEFSYRAEVKMPVTLGAGPYGTRLFFEVVGGSFEGERLKGKVLSGGGDWLLAGEDGFARLDVRAQFLTDDGAAIYSSYGGLLQMTPKVQAALADPKGSTDFADQYFRTTPRFETGDPRYAWLNQCMFVSEGRILPGRTVEYKCYRVV
jgi:Protein of unknown function (DUF3237)